jgi:L-amino acid N-acyltransferase YncA
MVREAVRDDAAPMARLYAEGLARGEVGFHPDGPTEEAFADWFFDDVTYGGWVALEGPTLLGWACLRRFDERAAFAPTAEVFVCGDFSGDDRASGSALVAAVLGAARERRLRSVVHLWSGNQSIMTLLRTAGFASAGEVPAVFGPAPSHELTLLQHVLVEGPR